MANENPEIYKKNLILKRGQQKAKLTRFASFLNEESDDITRIKVRAAKIESVWQEFDEIQSEIEKIDETEINTNEREEFENQYCNLMAKAENIIASGNRSSSVNTSNSGENQTFTKMAVKLPQIELIKFSGQYAQWIPFYDTFLSLIHENTALNNIQKFHYLKSSLTAEAAQVIASLGVSADNYETAWELLKKRFENRKLIIQNHLTTLFNLPSVNKDSAKSLRELLDSVNIHIRSLKTLGMPIESWDVIIIHLLTTKFDFFTNKEWESSIHSGELPTMKEMETFLTRRCQMLESLPNKPSFQKQSITTNNNPNSTYSSNRPQAFKGTFRTAAHINTQTNQLCPICKQSHNISQCPDFIKLTAKLRFDEVKKQKLCVNCLRGNHQTLNCYSHFTCKYCNKKHHTLLHLDQTPAQSTIETIPPVASTSTVTNHCRETQGPSQILLSTAIIHVYDREENMHDCRALLDVGSQSNFMSKSLCEKLKLKPQVVNSVISGITHTVTNITQLVQTKLKSRCNAFTTNLDCLVIPKISERLPLCTFQASQILIPENIQLADPAFNVSNQIDILLGAELFWKLLCVGKIKLANNQPYFQKTQLGWVVGGSFNYPNPSKTIACNLSLRTLDQKLTKFWEIEEVQTKPNLSPEELECENHYQKTYTRDSTGRFIVKLPFKKVVRPLGSSRVYAQKRLFSLENKLNKNPKLREEYSNFLNEYLDLKHMELVPAQDANVESSHTFYLPHHAVIKESSISTKVRVVFDGSAKSSSGVSLNNNLMVGPTLQQDLFSILCRFRTHKYAITADIQKMYRQILINPEDRDCQRILWRNNSDEPIKTYKLSTVTYGTASAPFLAVRCLHQLAIDNKEGCPLTSSIILRDFYMDDLLSGTNNLQEAIVLRNQLISILASGGFKLCKFASNDLRVLTVEDDQPEIISLINLDKEHDIKTLGIYWNTHLDVFKYSLNLQQSSHKITKRVILSLISQIFDPLGLIGPVLIRAKVILQKMWSLNLGWDEEIPTELQGNWSQFVTQLEHLKELKLPRRVMGDTPKFIEMHGFCDASESAYGCSIYIRSTDKQNNHHVQLLCAKSRVAPLKQLTIPRLELCGALLLARLASKIIPMLNLRITNQYLWTDSSIILAWLSTSNNLKTFVANRVSEIKTLTNIKDWRHVSTDQNPADIISRGLSAVELIASTLWFNGPHWLSLDHQNWPITNITIENTVVPEQRVEKICLAVLPNFSIGDKYSSFTRLQRVTAYCLRFANNCKGNNKVTGPLTCQELSKAITTIIKLTQAQAFARELIDLQRQHSVSKSSKLISLNPFIDREGIIRVGGRLRNAEINYNQKFPIILPHKHHITNLIITYEHVKQLHAGPQTTLAALKQRYWPVAGRGVVRQIIYKCVKCFRAKPRSVEQLMGDLPRHRVEPSRAFIHSGIDYGGPIYIKEGHGRSQKTIKTYIALFICFATKAIHIELVCDLTSEAFMNALKRFMSRRGKVSHIYSDNATNFVGANRILHSEFQRLFKSESFKSKVIEALTLDNVTWHFIPPRSPHFGGLWEAGIKSVKYHLKRIIGEASLTYDEMYTLLTQIEACLNSRPLTPLTNDPDDLHVLTPAHFLIGDSLNAPIQEDITIIPQNRLSRWQRVQQLSQHFWRRWSVEYLGQLQPRTRWQQNVNNSLKIGTMVLIRDDQRPPLQWPLGRIVDTHPGNDGIIRVVTIKTNSGVVKRAITKLCVLPIDGISESE